MRIEKLNEIAVESIWFKSLQPGGHNMVDSQLPIIVGGVSGLPGQIDAIVVTSDWQGIIIKDEREYLLGEILAEILPIFIEIELEVLPQNVGVFLCGQP